MHAERELSSTPLKASQMRSSMLLAGAISAIIVTALPHEKPWDLSLSTLEFDPIPIRRHGAPAIQPPIQPRGVGQSRPTEIADIALESPKDIDARAQSALQKEELALLDGEYQKALESRHNLVVEAHKEIFAQQAVKVQKITAEIADYDRRVQEEEYKAGQKSQSKAKLWVNTLDVERELLMAFQNNAQAALEKVHKARITETDELDKRYHAWKDRMAAKLEEFRQAVSRGKDIHYDFGTVEW